MPDDYEPLEEPWKSIMELSFRLCYIYYNWTGAIKVPAPTMLAHKLAYIAGSL